MPPGQFFSSADAGIGLLCRVGTLRCAFPLTAVRETMRPLPVETLSGMPAFVSGLALIRGAPVAVLDMALLLHEQGRAQQASRFVLVAAGERQVACAVDAVLSLQSMAAERLQALPPLLSRADGEAVAAVGRADAALLLVLNSARLVPDDVWRALDGAALRAGAVTP